MTVDQSTPINIHFTVDVVRWPLEMASTSNRYGWFTRPSIIPNHRVRMRIKLGGTVGRGISPTYNWPSASPETSLSYRWNLVTNLDKYLRSECGRHCGGGIMLLDIQRQGSLYNWSTRWATNCKIINLREIIVLCHGINVIYRYTSWHLIYVFLCYLMKEWSCLYLTHYVSETLFKQKYSYFAW